MNPPTPQQRYPALAMLGLEPDSIRALVEEGLRALEHGATEAGHRRIEAVARTTPSAVMALLMGRLHLDAGRAVDALAWLREAEDRRQAQGLQDLGFLFELAETRAAALSRHGELQAARWVMEDAEPPDETRKARRDAWLSGWGARGA